MRQGTNNNARSNFFLPKTENQMSDYEREIMKDLSDSAILLRCRKQKIKKELSKSPYKRIPLGSRSPNINKKYPNSNNKKMIYEPYGQKENFSKNLKNKKNPKFRKENKYSENKNFSQKKIKEKNIQRSKSPHNFKQSYQRSPIHDIKYPALNKTENSVRKRNILIIEDRLFIQSKPTFFDKKALTQPLNHLKSKSRNVPKREISVSNIARLNQITKITDEKHFLAFKFNGKIYHSDLEKARKFEKFSSVVINSQNFILQNLKEKIFSYDPHKNIDKIEIIEFEIEDYMLEKEREIKGYIDIKTGRFRKLKNCLKKRIKVNKFNKAPEQIGKDFKYALGFVECKRGNFGNLNFKEEKKFQKIVLSLGEGDRKQARILAHRRILVGYVAFKTKFFIPKMEPFDNFLTWDQYFMDRFKLNKVAENRIMEKKNFEEEKNQVRDSLMKFKNYEENFQENFEKKFQQKRIIKELREKSPLFEKGKGIVSHVNLGKYSNSRKINSGLLRDKSFGGLQEKISKKNIFSDKNQIIETPCKFERSHSRGKRSYKSSIERRESVSTSPNWRVKDFSPKFNKKKLWDVKTPSKSPKKTNVLNERKKFEDVNRAKYKFDQKLKKNNSLETRTGKYGVYNLTKLSKSSKILRKKVKDNERNNSVKKLKSSRRISSQSPKRDEKRCRSYQTLERRNEISIESLKKFSQKNIFKSSKPNNFKENLRGKQILDRFMYKKTPQITTATNQPRYKIQNRNNNWVAPSPKSPEQLKSLPIPAENQVISSRRLTEVKQIIEYSKIENPIKDRFETNNSKESPDYMTKSRFTPTSEIKFENGEYFDNYTFKENNSIQFSASTTQLLDPKLIEEKRVLSQMSNGTNTPVYDTRTDTYTDSIDSKSYNQFPLPTSLETSRDQMNLDNYQNIIDFQKNNAHFNHNENIEMRKEFDILKKFTQEESRKNSQSQVISLDTEHYEMIKDIFQNDNLNSPSLPSMSMMKSLDLQQKSEEWVKQVNHLNLIQPCKVPSTVYPSRCTSSICTCSLGIAQSLEKNNNLSKCEKIQEKKKRKKSKKKNKKKRNKSKSKSRGKKKKIQKKKSMKERFHEELTKLKKERESKEIEDSSITPANKVPHNSAKVTKQSCKAPPNTVNQRIKMINIDIGTKQFKSNHLQKSSLIDKLSPIEPIEEFSDGDSILSFKVPDNPDDCLRLKSIDKYTIIRTSSKKRDSNISKSKCSSSKDTRESKNGVTQFESMDEDGQELEEESLQNRVDSGDYDFRKDKLRRYSTLDLGRHSVIEEEFRDDSKLDKLSDHN